VSVGWLVRSVAACFVVPLRRCVVHGILLYDASLKTCFVDGKLRGLDATFAGLMTSLTSWLAY